MKITNRVLATVAVASLIAVVAIGDASATCANARLFGTIDTETQTYSYINMPAGADNSTVVGRFWQADNRSAGNEGTYDDTIWLRFYPPTSVWYISGDMGGDGVFGCPNGDLIVTLENNDGSYISWRQAETPALSLWWNLASFGDQSFNQITRPVLANRSPAGTSVNFDVTAPQAVENGGDSITGFRVMQRRLSVQGNPGRNPADFTPGVIVPPGGTVPLTVDCTVQDQVYLGFQVVYGTGGGQFFGDHVGASVNVSCNPNMADPDTEFKIIDKPSVRPKRER